MWKRRIAFGYLLLLLSLRWLSAQPLQFQDLDSPTLLKEAASKIQELMILNEKLKEETKQSVEVSKNLETQLEILNSERDSIERYRELEVTARELRDKMGRIGETQDRAIGCIEDLRGILEELQRRAGSENH